MKCTDAGGISHSSEVDLLVYWVQVGSKKEKKCLSAVCVGSQ